MGDKDQGGLAGLFGKAEKWLRQQGVTHEDLEKAKADREALDAQEAAEKQAGERADRSAHAGGSTVSLRGVVNATVDSGLAAKTEEEDGALIVTVETIDPVSVEGGTFTGYAFTLPNYSGPATYDLSTADLSGLIYELWVDTGGEGFFWAPEYGPGIVTVSDGGKTMKVRFAYRDPGSNKVDLEGTVRLN